MRDSDMFKDQKTLVDKVNHYRNTNFGIDWDEQLEKFAKRAKGLIYKLEQIPEEKIQSDKTQAMYHYLKGFLLEVSYAEYHEMAREELDKALALDETLLDAMIARGNCALKLGGEVGLDNAKSCFDYVIEKDQSRKDLFQRLAMLEIRMLEEKTGGHIVEEMIDECISHANKAVEMGVKDAFPKGEKDGLSWYILGNAYVTAFSVRGFRHRETIQKAYKAYSKAMQDAKMNNNPYLLYSMSVANMLLGYYRNALFGFEGLRNSSAQHTLPQQTNLEIVLNRICDLLLDVNNDINILSTPLQTGSSFASWDLDPSYEKTTVRSLTEGENPGKAILAEVLASIDNSGEVPWYYVARDRERTNFVLTVFGYFRTGIENKDEVMLLDPAYQSIDFRWKGKQYRFKLVRVNLREKILVNAIPIRKPPSIVYKGKSKINTVGGHGNA